MRFDLTALARRARNPRRKAIALRDIAPPATLATDLYLAAYADVVRLWQQAGDRLASEYARTLSSLTTDSTADMSGILDEADDVFTRLLLRLEPLLRDWTLRAERWHRRKWVAAVQSASSVDLSTMLGAEDVRETLADYIRWNVSLVKDVGAQARKRLSDIVFAGVQNRTPARDVAASIREVHGMTRRRALGIASDQLSRVTSALARERRRQAGLPVYEFKHSGKLHPRATHKARNGNLYSSDPNSIGTKVDRKTVQAEPPRGDRAGEPPFVVAASLRFSFSIRGRGGFCYETSRERGGNRAPTLTTRTDEVRMAARADITPEVCRKLLRYDPETGKLFWRARPLSMFATKRAFSSWNTKHAGKEAFVQPNDEGYLRGVMLRHTFRAQRIAWAVHYGRWPEGDVDHINGVIDDNRIANLRDVPRAENSRNRRLRIDNSSGATGVRIDLNTMRWRATIRARGRNIHLGVFDTKEEAVAARLSAQSEFGYHPNHGSL